MASRVGAALARRPVAAVAKEMANRSALDGHGVAGAFRRLCTSPRYGAPSAPAFSSSPTVGARSAFPKFGALYNRAPSTRPFSSKTGKGEEADPSFLTRLLGKPFEEVMVKDVQKGWVETSGIRKVVYTAGSVIFAAVTGTGLWVYFTLESRISNNVEEKLAKDKAERDLAEKKEAKKRLDWEISLLSYIHELKFQIHAIQERELKNRSKVIQAEEVLRRFGFSSDAETYCDIANRFHAVQNEISSLKTQIPESTEGDIAIRLHDLDSQVLELRERLALKKVLKASDLLWSEKQSELGGEQGAGSATTGSPGAGSATTGRPF